MRIISDSPADTTIDRDLDQTAKHIHHFLGNAGCPTCKAVANYHEPAKLYSGGNEIKIECADRPIVDEFSHPSFSDVDLGERVDEGNHSDECLCPERDAVTDLYKQACTDRDAALMRVSQFERFTDVLATHLDALQAIAKPQPKSEYPKAA